MIDISQPYAPAAAQRDRLRYEGNCRGAAVAGEYVYLPAEEEGIVILRFSR